VIADPTIEVSRDSLPSFAPGAEVMVTVVSSGATARAFLHTGGLHASPISRDELATADSVTFHGSWHVPMHPGIYHAAVDLLSGPTLSETDPADGPYDSEVWALPYVVRAP